MTVLVDPQRAPTHEVTSMLPSQFADASTMLADAADDLLAFTGYPQARWRKIWSTDLSSGSTDFAIAT
jgi:putative transposase